MSHAPHSPDHPPTPNRCALCGAPYAPKRPHQKFCSEKHRKEAWEREHRISLENVLIMGGVRYRLVPERLWLELQKGTE